MSVGPLVANLRLRAQDVRSLAHKGAVSLRVDGVCGTYQRIQSKLHGAHAMRKRSRAPLFSDEELAAQRVSSLSDELRFSVVTPLFNTSERFLREMIESVQAQTYGNWELCLADGSDDAHGYVGETCREYAELDERICYLRLAENLGISGNSNAALGLATGDYVALLDHDDLLHPAALFELARTIRQTGADFVYTDETTFVATPADARTPHFKPAFAPDNLRANNYLCHLSAFKRELLELAGTFDAACDGSQDHDLFLRLTEHAQCIAHLPEVLYFWRASTGSAALGAAEKPYTITAGTRAVRRHLQRVGLSGEVSTIVPNVATYRIRYAIAGVPKLSIIVRAQGSARDLQRCLDSVRESTSWSNYELVLVVNDQTSREARAYCERMQRTCDTQVMVCAASGPTAFAAYNEAAKVCTGDYLVLLDSRTQVVSPDWLQELLMYAQRSDVGIVGAKLAYPNGKLRHAGLGIGLSGLVGRYFEGAAPENNGYMGRLLYAQNVSAVSGACMMARHDVWNELGGFDESFVRDLADVDLCLRAREAGYLIVWTPFAELLSHAPKASERRRAHPAPAAVARVGGVLPGLGAYLPVDAYLFLDRWQRLLDAGDPYYNPNFRFDGGGFAIRSEQSRQAPRVVYPKRWRGRTLPAETSADTGEATMSAIESPATHSSNDAGATRAGEMALGLPELIASLIDADVLLVSHELSLTGAPIALLSMARAMVGMGLRPAFASLMDGPLRRDIEAEGLPLVVLPGTLEGLGDAVEGSFSLVVANTIVTCDVVSALNGRNVPVLWWMHEVDALYNEARLLNVPHWLLPNVSVVAAGPRARATLLNRRPYYEVGELLYGVEDAKAMPGDSFAWEREDGADGADGDGAVVTFALVGSVCHRKGQDILLDALDLLSAEERSRCRLVFVGGDLGPDGARIAKRMRDAAESAANIWYLPSLPIERMPALYESIDCLLCASRDDPMPIVVAEACRHSKLTICSEHIGQATLLQERNAGIVYEDDDPRKLAACMRRVLSEQGEAFDAMRRNARAVYEEYFSEEVFLSKLSALLERVRLSCEGYDSSWRACGDALRAYGADLAKASDTARELNEERALRIEYERKFGEERALRMFAEAQRDAAVELCSIMENSTSWRTTAPFRVLGRILRGGKL